MESINKENLFPVFQNSNLADQFEDIVTIPKKYLLSKNETITKLNVNKHTFKSIMEKLRFFMVKNLPHEIYDYVMEDCQADLKDFKDFHYEELVFLRDEYCEIEGIREEYDTYNNESIRCRVLVTEQSINDMKENIMIKCLEHHYYDLMLHLVERGFPKEEYFAESIADTGNIEDYKFLIKNDFPIDTNICGNIATNGNFDCLKYVYNHLLKNKEDPFTRGILESAVSGDNWKIVKYVMSNLNKEKMFNEMTCFVTSRAAQNGNLEMLKYFHKLGAPLHAWCFEWAVHCIYDELFNTQNNPDYNKYLDCIKYLHQNNCPHNDNLVEKACRYANIDIVKYLIENGYSYDLNECIEKAEENVNKRVLEYLKTLF